jgi:hypothetical protein
MTAADETSISAESLLYDLDRGQDRERGGAAGRA